MFEPSLVIIVLLVRNRYSYGAHGTDILLGKNFLPPPFTFL